MADDAHETLSYEEFGLASRELAQTIAAAGFTPDAIIALARGGLPLAGVLGYALDVKMLGSLNVEYYTGTGGALDEPVALPPTLDRQALAGRSILLVDDVADSGRSLALVRRLLQGGAGEVRTACLYSKPGTVEEPDYVWRHIDRWIDFPWSVDGPVVDT